MTKTPEVVYKVPPARWLRDEELTLAQFILRKMAQKDVDALLDRIDTHGKYGKGEKSHV